MTTRSSASASARRAEANLQPIAVTPIAVTLGDPAGIGPDITLQAWRDRKAHALHPYAVYGDAKALRDRARALGLGVSVVVIDRLEQASQMFAEALPVVQPAAAGRSRQDADAGIVAAIEAAAAAALGGEALALVTNPIA